MGDEEKKDPWAAYRQRYAATPEQQQQAYQQAQQGALKAGAASPMDNLKSAWLLMTGQANKDKK